MSKMAGRSLHYTSVTLDRRRQVRYTLAGGHRKMLSVLCCMQRWARCLLSGTLCVRLFRAGIAGVLLAGVIGACDSQRDRSHQPDESRPPHARFAFADGAAAGYALDSLLAPPLLAPDAARCGGVFAIDEIDSDRVVLRRADTSAGTAGRTTPRAAAGHLLDLLDPSDPHPEAFRLYFIDGAADYARGHAPAERVGIHADDEHLILERVDGRDVTLTARSGEIATRLTHPAFSPPHEVDERARVRAELRRTGSAVVPYECDGEITVEIAVAEADAGPHAHSRAADAEYGRPAVEATVRSPGTAYDILVANTSAVADTGLRRGVLRIARSALDRKPPTDGFERVRGIGNTASVDGRAGAAPIADAGGPLRLIAAPALASKIDSLAGALADHGLDAAPASGAGAGDYAEALFRGDFDLALIRWESESGAPGEVLRLFRPYDPRNFTGSGAGESFELFARQVHAIDFELYVDDGDDNGGLVGVDEAIERFGNPRVSRYGVPYF